MRAPARFLMVLSLAVWIGGIVFFSFVVAPTAFSLLPARELAGSIVSRSLRSLHLIGLIAGAVFLAATLLATFRRAKALRALVALMLLCTAISQFGITPQMERIRTAVGGPIQALPPEDAGRAVFDRLHHISIILEGVVLLAGISTVALLSRESEE